MEWLSPFVAPLSSGQAAPCPAQLAAAMAADLAACDRVGAAYGLALTPQQGQALAQQRWQALAETGRVEFGGGILPQLAYAFCDSPYVSPRDWADTLGQLQQLFYRFKGECRKRLTDEALLAAMRALFDGAAQGSLPVLADATPDDLLQAAR